MTCASSMTAQSLYWDSNGTVAGAGATPTGTWGTSLFWSTDSDGTATPGAWTPGATAIFSAGTDAVNAFTVTVGSAQTVGKIVVEEGTPTFNGSTLTLNGNATIEVASERTATIGTTIIAGSAGMTKEGAGTLINNASAHTYTGGTKIKGGILQTTASAANSFGNPTGTITMEGGELRTALTRTTWNPLSILQNAVFSKDTGASVRTATFTNALTTSPGVTVSLRNPGSATFNLRFTGGANSDANWIIGQTGDGLCQLQFMGNTNWPDQIFSGTISGPGVLRRTSNLTGNGASTIISGDNTYSGGTEINGGMIGFARSSTGNPVTSGPIGTGPLTILDDTVIGIFAHGTARTIGNDVVFGDVAFNLQIPGANDLTMTGSLNLNSTARSLVVNNSGLTTFSGQISGGANITKAGTGTLAWSGDNINSGTIIVDTGALLVNNISGSGTGSGLVIVNSGATLGGTGSVGGAATVNGSVAPGTTGAGTLAFANGVDLGSGTYLWDLTANTEVAGNFDLIAVTGGNLDLGGSSVLSLNFTGSATVPNAGTAFWQSARSWTVVNVDGGSNSGSSNFSSIEGTNGITAGTFTTSVDGSGNVVLNYAPSTVVVPEPVISSITGAGTSSVTVTWSAMNGVTYLLQYKTDLNTVTWTDLDPVVASGSSASSTDTTATSDERFYRVRVQ